MWLCEFMHSVLNDINYASKTIQKRDINLGEASKVLAETKAKLQIYRNDFELFKCEKLQENMVLISIFKKKGKEKL